MLDLEGHLQVGGSNRVAGPVRVCEGVKKGVERAFHELHKGLFDGILLAATEHTVLENVRNALAVFNRGSQDCSKGLVFILVKHRDHFRTCNIQERP